MTETAAPPDPEPSPDRRGKDALDLFLASFGLLFLELACIRWLPAHLRMLSFFANFVLLACFLGMSLGLLRSRTRTSLMLSLPLLLLVAITASQLDIGIKLDAYGSGTIYFGQEYRETSINVPFWLVLVPVFVAVSLLFVGLGETMGLLFERFPPLTAYCINIGGSIAGTLGFMAASALSLGPLVWFSLAGACILWLLRGNVRHLAVSGIFLALSLTLMASMEKDAYWSPYSRIELRNLDGSHELAINGITHQTMFANNHPRAGFYNFPYLMNRFRGERPVGDVLIIGAGSGNDVAHALLHGASSVDAVDIDPVIQRLGRELHPEKPYADPRVRKHTDDGRSFVRRTQRMYDFVVYAYVDSLSLLSQFGQVRLEHYLFTQGAFQQVKRHLKPDGIFVIYNLFREPWLIQRIYSLLEKEWGPDNVMLIVVPSRKDLTQAGTEVNLALFMAGDIKPIKEAFKTRQFFTRGEQNAEIPVFPVENVGVLNAPLPTDEWPFLYVKQAAVPLQNIHGALIVLGLALVLLYGVGGMRPGRSFGWHFFLLGAAFMLIETRGVARFALLFGTTWLSNSITFLGVLSVILLANLVAIRLPRLGYLGLYAGLGLSIAVDAAVPFATLLAMGPVERALVGSLLLFLPIFFAGLVFARSFRQATSPGAALGANVLGAMAGGCLENLSVVIGYRWLIGVAALLYLASFLTRPRS